MTIPTEPRLGIYRTGDLIGPKEAERLRPQASRLGFTLTRLLDLRPYRSRRAHAYLLTRVCP